jgi:hypothetical protein
MFMRYNIKTYDREIEMEDEKKPFNSQDADDAFEDLKATQTKYLLADRIFRATNKMTEELLYGRIKEKFGVEVQRNPLLDEVNTTLDRVQQAAIDRLSTPPKPGKP